MNHISAHWEYITCPYCGAKLRYHPLYYICIYPPPPTAPLECPICGAEIWVTGRDIEVAPALPPPVYTCPYCGETFDTLEELNAHIASEHPGFPPVRGILDWLKANWKWLTVGGISLGVIIVLTRRK